MLELFIQSTNILYSLKLTCPFEPEEENSL